MALATIRVRCLRAFYAHGRLYAAGAVYSFDPLTAADIVCGGRGEYVDADAPGLVRAAVQADVTRMLAEQRVTARAPWRVGYF